MPTEHLPGEDDAGAPLDPDAPLGQDAIGPDAIGPDAIELRYRYHRARRQARIRQKQESRLARYRFYIVMFVLIALTLGFVIVSWHEIQRLFGL
ncbi:MAG: hypothetical protein QOI27_2047 [Gaiellaceae bacterium]|jgi:hypothetical protein|nr:hypothetical protein [Gaiellaceae bacterium]MDX6469554.1 hypothetical protein [Gaiellaceae bacterium]MDX6474415.1 hypothetical protein [Gaiellaceae bacterium]